MNKQGFFSDAEIISVYSREKAMADGLLVDVSESSECQQLGFLCPVALTRSVWDQFVEVPKGVIGQDLAGCLWDVLWMLRSAIRTGGRGMQMQFSLHVRNDNREGMPPLVSLKAACGPGDDGSPTITIMLPEED